MLTTWTPYARIGRPLEAHAVRSADEYRARQAATIADMQRIYPARQVPDPYESLDAPATGPFVSGGRWVLMCSCGNAPSYDPEWQLACCFECGRIYSELAPPDGWADGEAVLMDRDQMRNRHWFPTTNDVLGMPAETVVDLVQENAQQLYPAENDAVIVEAAAIAAVTPQPRPVLTPPPTIG